MPSIAELIAQQRLMQQQPQQAEPQPPEWAGQWPNVYGAVGAAREAVQPFMRGSLIDVLLSKMSGNPTPELMTENEQMMVPIMGMYKGSRRVIPVKELEKWNFETGKPVNIQAYHGTDKVFDLFDDKKLGEYTGAKSAKEGHFFSSNRENAEMYAGITEQQYNKYNSKYKDAVRKVSDLLGVKKESNGTVSMYELRRAIDTKMAEIEKGEEAIISKFNNNVTDYDIEKLDDLFVGYKDIDMQKAINKADDLGIIKEAKRLKKINEPFLRELDKVKKNQILLDSIDLKKENYARKMGQEDQLEGWGRYSYETKDVRPNIRKEVLQMENPFVYREPPRDGTIKNISEIKSISEIVKIAKKNGHDGVIIRGKEDPLKGDIYIVLSSQQIQKRPPLIKEIAKKRLEKK